MAPITGAAATRLPPHDDDALHDRDRDRDALHDHDHDDKEDRDKDENANDKFPKTDSGCALLALRTLLLVLLQHVGDAHIVK